jgi:hypothetical protein
MKKPTKWNGEWPAKCESCEEDLSTVPYFVFGLTHSGKWELLCLNCHGTLGVGVGIGEGIGQMYDSKTLEKVQG